MENDTNKNAENRLKDIAGIEVRSVTKSKLAKSSEKQEIKRDEKGRIIPGQISLNPAGKPKGLKSMSTKLKEYLKTTSKIKNTGEVIALDEAIVRKLTEKAIAGQDKAIEMIFDRTEGKPVTRTALTDTDGKDLIDGDLARKMSEALAGIK